jgi:hypothetical protein
MLVLYLQKARVKQDAIFILTMEKESACKLKQNGQNV